MHVFKQMWRTWLRAWYEGRLEEVKAGRIAVIEQARQAEEFLDRQEGKLRSKLRGLA